MGTTYLSSDCYPRGCLSYKDNSSKKQIFIRLVPAFFFVKMQGAPLSPEGCTIITPGDRARRAREPGVDGTQEPAPGGRHKRSLVEALSNWKSPFLLVVAPSGRGFWGSSHPGLRRAPRFLTRGYFCVALRAEKTPG